MRSFKLQSIASAAFCWAASAVVALAHPGHYHPPGEDDEFNALRADWLHLHGWLEPCLLLAAAFSAVGFFMTSRTKFKVGAAVICSGSLALLAAV